MVGQRRRCDLDVGQIKQRVAESVIEKVVTSIGQTWNKTMQTRKEIEEFVKEEGRVYPANRTEASALLTNIIS
jgi:flagellar motor switch protein FliM